MQKHPWASVTILVLLSIAGYLLFKERSEPAVISKNNHFQDKNISTLYTISAISEGKSLSYFPNHPKEANTKSINTITPEESISSLILALESGGYEQRHILEKLWARASDGNTTSKILSIFEHVKNTTSNSECFRFASMAHQDLTQLQELRSGALTQADKKATSFSSQAPIEEELFSNEETQRFEAIAHLESDRNSDPKILLQLYINESSAQIRLEIVRSLWRRAGDDAKNAQDLINTLQMITNDEEETVAKAAATAVEDLKRLYNK